MIRKLSFVMIALALLLSACQAQASATPGAVALDELRLVDDLGREIVLSEPARRIVSLAPSNTEILFALGAADQLVGRDQFSDYPAEAAQVTDIGSSFEALNTELIVSLEPDLVLAAEINTPEQVSALEQVGITVYYMNNPATLEDLYENLATVAQLSGRDADAKALIESLQTRVAEVDKKLAPISSRPSVFYELDGTDPAKPYTAGKGTFITLLIERAGGYNIASDIEGYPQLSLEQVVEADPAFIILGDSMWGVTPEMVAARPGWGDLQAVQSGNVYPFDDNLVSRPGPRLVEGLETLARLLHPGLFE
jgi:iron complex transport system substrate-binding protein